MRARADVEFRRTFLNPAIDPFGRYPHFCRCYSHAVLSARPSRAEQHVDTIGIGDAGTAEIGRYNFDCYCHGNIRSSDEC